MNTTIEKAAPASLETMIIKAIEVGNVETIEKMLALKERVDKENARKAFKEAFADWQGNKPEIKKTKAGWNANYYYAPLASIQKQVDPVLSNTRITYRWEHEQKEKEIRVTCVLSHIDGHEERTSITVPHDGSGGKNAIQAVGSAVSYGERYTLLGALGLSADDDDDGKEAKKAPAKLPELTPKHKHWKAIIEGIKAGQTTIEALKAKKYTISEKTENQLKEELTK